MKSAVNELIVEMPELNIAPPLVLAVLLAKLAAIVVIFAPLL